MLSNPCLMVMEDHIVRIGVPSNLFEQEEQIVLSNLEGCRTSLQLVQEVEETRATNRTSHQAHQLVQEVEETLATNGTSLQLVREVEEMLATNGTSLQLVREVEETLATKTSHQLVEETQEVVVTEKVGHQGILPVDRNGGNLQNPVLLNIIYPDHRFTQRLGVLLMATPSLFPVSRGEAFQHLLVPLILALHAMTPHQT